MCIIKTCTPMKNNKNMYKNHIYVYEEQLEHIWKQHNNVRKLQP